MKKNILLACAAIALVATQMKAQVSFNASIQNGCAPLAVTFSNTSSGGGISYYIWNFGDGSAPVTSMNTSHTYTNSGNFMAVLTAYNSGNNPMGSFQVGINVNGLNAFNINLSADSACPGQNIGFSYYSSGSNLSWNFGDGSPTVNNQQNTMHSYSTVGTYSATFTANAGCGNQTVTEVIVIKNNAPANASFSYPWTNCPHDMIYFNADDYTSNNNTWNFGDGTGNVSSSSASISHSYSVTGNYVVSHTLVSTCGQTAVKTDTVHIMNGIHFPSGTSAYASPNNVCPNDPINFNYNTNALTNVWGFGPGDSSYITSPTHSFSSLGTHTVTLKLTNGCGNDTTVSTIVTVGSNIPFGGNPQMQFYPNPACPHDAVYFQSSPAATYSWTFGDGGTSSSPSPAHSYTTTGTYTVGLNLYNNCGRDTSLTGTLVVSNTVVPMLNHSGNNGNWGIASPIGCPGDSILFYAYGADTYTFSFGDGTSSSTTYTINNSGGGGPSVVNLISHSYTATGVYTITLTVSNGCGNIASDTVHITIGSGSPVNGGIINVNNPSYNACQPVNMIGLGGVQYNWHFGDGDTLQTATASINHSYTMPGTYTISLHVKNGCGNTATYTQSINIVGMSTTTSFTDVACYGGNTGMAQVMVTGAGNSPYMYSINGGSYSSSNNFTGLTMGTYTLGVMDAGGCMVSNTVTINQPAQLMLSASSTNSSGCGGSTGSATVSVSGGTPGYTYSWQGGSTSASISNLAAGAYSVTVTDANSCHAITTAAVNDAGAPAVTYTTPYSPVCAGTNTIALSGGSPAGGTYSGSGVSGSIFTPSSSNVGTNVIVYTYHTGTCTATASNTITVNAVPTVNATSDASGNQICGGDTVMLIASGTTSYTWSANASGLGSLVSPFVNVLITTSTTFTVTGSNGNCSDMQTIMITVNPLPATPTVTVAGSVLTSSSATAYQWYFNGNPINGATAQSYTWSTSGNYAVEVTNASGCSAMSASVAVGGTGIANVAANVQTLVKPNPFTNSFELEFANDANSNATIELYNAIGQRVAVIHNGAVASGNNHFTFNTLPDMQNGMYFVRIQTGTISKVIKVSLFR